jgi:effector-binding domain-containing protein
MTTTASTAESPRVTRSPPRRVWSKHAQVALDELPDTLGEGFAELYAAVARTHNEPDGPPFVVYHTVPTPGAKWEIDICAPVAASLLAPPGITYSEMAAEPIVSLLHVGPYESLDQAYAVVGRFMTDNDLTPSGPPREFYLSEPDVPPAEIQTLIEWPVAAG